MRPLIGTSTKMHFTPTEVAAYLDALLPLVADIRDRDLFVLPPFPAIFVARDRLQASNVRWGAQDVHPDESGAFTGDVSAPMLADLGCSYVEVGHSERRRDHGETPERIAAKVAAVLRWGMTPILCIGEATRATPAEVMRELLVDLERTLARVPPEALGRIVIAYEPVWAIGNGATASPPDAVAAVARGIHKWLATRSPSGLAGRVIYGGSVDESVARDLMARPDLDGLFVGRRALDHRAFATIAHTPVGS